MTTISAFDSAFGPSLAAAQAARTQGISAWFGYLGGPGAFHPWRADEWAVLRQAGFTPGALWVPTYGLGEDPVSAAHDALVIAGHLGLYGAIMLDTERAMLDTAGQGRLQFWVNGFVATVMAAGRPCPVYAGAQYVPPGVPGFLPLWGSAIYPASTQAIQYGPAVRDGVEVDVDLLGVGFPLASWSAPVPVPVPPTPSPNPSPSPNTGDDEDMWIFACANEPTILVVGGLAVVLPDAYDVAQLQNAGAHVVTVDAPFMDRLKTKAA
jgi:hypothetical protein